MASALGLVLALVPGATPKKPASGLMAHSRPSPADVHPADVIADREDPELITQAQARHQHRQVGLATGGGKAAAMYVTAVTAGTQILDAEDQHVLCHPAFVATHGAGDAQRSTFAQKSIAAVARANAPDLALAREVDDEAAIRGQVADRVQAF